MSFTVVISTYGDDHWKELAETRALPSAEAFGCIVVMSHADTLHEARNNGLAEVDTEYVVHLDADDELEASYRNAHVVAARSGADLVPPVVRYVRPGWYSVGAIMPKVAGHTHVCEPSCLPEGNWMVVGTLARTELVRSVGGWRDWPVYEDWDLWLRCWKARARIVPCFAAVYRAHMRVDSRNRGPSQDIKDECHRAIVADVLEAPV